VSLAKKLNLKPGAKLRVVAKPKSMDLDGVATATNGEAVLVFARTAADLARAMPAFEAARADRIAWIAYPKAGQLDTDLSRDVLAKLVSAEGVQPVRQVALDDVWSALRFRPGKRKK
jgi:hypothetical protein